MLGNHSINLILVDPDRVEPRNLVRQQFFPGDLGKFKSQALAERLSRQYGRPVAYSVYPYMHDMVYKDLGSGLVTQAAQGLIISCVDNAAARRSIAENMLGMNWWLDAGNGFSSGQVLIGNADNMMYLEGCFKEKYGEVIALPLPSTQEPSLLIPVAKPAVDDPSCADAVASDEQSPVINQAMATLVLQFVYLLVKAELTWMGAYLDLELGTLQMVPADPVVVARLLSVKVDTLIDKKYERR